MGMQKGRQEGKQEEKMKIAMNLLKEGVEIALVAKSTGLSKSEVERLKIKTVYKCRMRSLG